MNFLPWHIVKKDFRYLRLYLAVWWSILVSNALVGAWCVQHIFHLSAQDVLKNNAEDILTGFNWFFLALDILLLGLVVDALLKNDSPIDQKAFWRTRPVGGGRMFRAKLISLGLFCFVVPGLIQAAGYSIFGFSLHEFLRELGQFAVIQGCFVAVITAAAMLFQRTIVGLLTFACVLIAVLVATVILPGFTGVATVVVLMADLRNLWIFPGLLFVTIFVASALIYTGHRRRAALFTLLGGLLLNASVGFYWMQHHPNPPSAFVGSPTRDDHDPWSVTPSSLTDQPSYAYSYSWRLHGWISNPALPELQDVGWRVQWSVAELNWPGAKTTELTYNPTLFWSYPVSLLNAPAAYAAAGYGRLIGATAESWRSIPLGVADDEEVAHLKKEPAQVSAQVHLQGGRLERLADLPAVTGTTWRSDLAAKHLVAVTLGNPASLSLIFDEISPWYSRWFETDAEIIGHNVINSHIFLLYNPQTKECLEGAPTESSMDSDPMFTWQRTTVTFSFANPTDATGRPGPDPGEKTPVDRLRWLSGARLVELELIPTQNLSVPVKIASFSLPAQAQK